MLTTPIQQTDGGRHPGLHYILPSLHTNFRVRRAEKVRDGDHHTDLPCPRPPTNLALAQITLQCVVQRRQEHAALAAEHAGARTRRGETEIGCWFADHTIR